MIEYFALFIPIVGTILTLILFRKHSVWWELVIPIVSSFLFILIFKFSAEKILTTDNEYRGGLAVKVQYYEYWETWVSKTCSRQVCSGSGKNRSCHTVYYDCSYCDRNSEQYYLIDNRSNKFNITKEKYLSLKNSWKNSKFVELNRSIRKHFSCGQDGDLYESYWNNQVLTSEPTVTSHSYENRIKASRSAFSYEFISQEQANNFGLYDYPKYYDNYKQNPILGLDSINIDNKDIIRKYYEYINGNLGTKNKVKVFVLIFKDKPKSISKKQESYWIGGNDNELVVCLGYNSKERKLDWVYPFSWTANKQILVEIREDISNLNEFDLLKTYVILDKNIKQYYKPRDFSEFNHLTVELPTWCIVLIYIFTLGITIGSCIWIVKNDFKN